MGSTLPQQLPELPWIASVSRRKKVSWRRFAAAVVIVIALHLFFIFFVAPYLELGSTPPARTEVTQISPEKLAQLKQKILKNEQLNPMLPQEMREDFKTKEASKDAKLMSKFNQTVPKEKFAGLQNDAPLDGSGGGGGKPKQEPQKKLDLSKLGLGTKLPKLQPEQQNSAPVGPEGPKTPYRPRGIDKNSLENENLLNAAESKYFSFFLRLEEPIIRNWFFLLRRNAPEIHSEMASHRVQAGTDLPITIEFVLDRQGNFHTIEIIESSTIPALDMATRDSVRKLGSLPNPPPDLFDGGQYYTRRLRFMVHVSEAPISDSRPDLSW
ncbi:MAG: energy transducer TonB [Deltaproteobacteria bacterium]|nr:energy transducer TonB [Deltaproteobacteria bacterium]